MMDAPPKKLGPVTQLGLVGVTLYLSIQPLQLMKNRKNDGVRRRVNIICETSCSSPLSLCCKSIMATRREKFKCPFCESLANQGKQVNNLEQRRMLE